MPADQQSAFWLPPPNSFAPRDDSIKLNVGIVGCGIGGLTSAIALLEAGHNVEIYEKSRFANETGAAINVTPNSSRILRYYGFDYESSRATLSENMIIYDSEDVNKRTVIPITNMATEYGEPWYFLHRVDLHNELKRMATERGAQDGNVAKLHLETTITSISNDGSIEFADGTKVKKDVVVAADGIRAAFCHLISDDVAPAKHIKSMSRFMIPSDDFANNPELMSLFSDGLKSLRILYKGPRSLVFYGCRGGGLQNFGLLYPPRLNGKDSQISNEEFAQQLEGFPQSVIDLCGQAETVSEWKVHTRDPLPKLSTASVAIVGDAAHPMPPFRALGGAMAIEDGAVLGVLLNNVSSASEVPRRLELYNQLRRNRTAAVQAVSAMHSFDPEDALKVLSPFFDDKPPTTRESIDMFTLGANVIRDAMIALEKEIGNRA